MKQMQKLPIGIQTFDEMITDDDVHIDKTEAAFHRLTEVLFSQLRQVAIPLDAQIDLRGDVQKYDGMIWPIGIEFSKQMCNVAGLAYARA